MALLWGKVFRATMFRDQAENEGGPIFKFANDGSQVERPIYVQYTKIPTALYDFIGSSDLVEVEGVGTYISRRTPAFYEGFRRFTPSSNLTEFRPWLWCTAVNRLDGMQVFTANSDGIPLGSIARLKLLYTTLPYEIVEDDHPDMNFIPDLDQGQEQENPLEGYPDEAGLGRYISRSYAPFIRSITVPRSILRWKLESGDASLVSGASPVVMEGIGKLEAGIMLEYTHHLRPDLPLDAVQRSMGKVNQFTFDFFPPETLLCEAPSIRVLTSAVGDRCYDVTFRFKYLPKIDAAGNERGHNWFLRFIKRIAPPNLLDYRLLTTENDGTGEKVYPSVDFAYLFRPDQ